MAYNLTQYICKKTYAVGNTVWLWNDALDTCWRQRMTGRIIAKTAKGGNFYQS